ncbi:PBSX family phage terminase large subunit [Corynebacterium coyleae]|uniref:PBSX family phage terminase large subunit n=1 Tax=Corynebacterium coyleae TaxID=53374 RepID=UPI0025510108|nr:phage terminase large subunit [Corynebacterium coyleae]MDK8241717.1 phage terminase large subunit [Corynebacterium coyleae]
MALTRRQQLALNRSTARINLWYGSVRSAKTYAQVHDFVARMTTWTGEGVNLVIGHSTNTVWRNIFQPIVTRPEFKAVAPYLRYRQNAPTGTLFGKPFNVVGANNEASWLAIQGLTVENGWGDEAAGWPLSFWDMLVSRLSLPQSRLLVTCNPSTANHYLKEKVVDKQHTDPDVHVEKFLLRENTTLSQDYIDMVARQYSGLFYRRMILAEWVAAEGAVYEGWNPDTMVVDELPELLQTVSFGLDYGTTHPTAGHALSLGRTTEAGPDGVLRPVTRLYLHNEFNPNPGKKRATDAQLADMLQAHLATLPHQPRYMYADPAAASFREELHTRGVLTHRADNHVVDGIRTIDSLLMNDQLKVHKGCTQLIGEMSEYRWDEKSAKRGEDKPVKENDDFVDSARYSVHSSRHLWRPLLTAPSRQSA